MLYGGADNSDWWLGAFIVLLILSIVMIIMYGNQTDKENKTYLYIAIIGFVLTGVSYFNIEPAKIELPKIE